MRRISCTAFVSLIRLIITRDVLYETVVTISKLGNVYLSSVRGREGEVLDSNSLLNHFVPIFTLVNRDTVTLAIYG